MKSHRTSAVRGSRIGGCRLVFLSARSAGHRKRPRLPAPAPTESASAVRDLQDQVRQLRSLVEEMRAENAESRAEMHQLRQDLQATRALLERPATPRLAQLWSGRGAIRLAANESRSPSTSANASAAQASTPLEERVQKLEESTSLIGSKIDEQYQTKVESASKYRARLHGIVLMNAFRNVGGSDNLDFPDYAEPVPPGSPRATLGATLRQSEIGFEIFGPTIAGARTSADVQLDFAGGFPATGNGVDFGIVRLQTASVRFDWEHTSVVAGQDSLFISPLSPTSFASLATPAFAFAGNLWGWTPQLRVEHRFSLSDQQTVTVQAGILDNLDWEYPYNSFYRWRRPEKCPDSPPTRYARPGPVRYTSTLSASASPATMAARTGLGTVTSTLGPEWRIGRFRFVPRLALSGEFYRGRGIGGLGGAIGTSILYGGDPNRPPLRSAASTPRADGAN